MIIRKSDQPEALVMSGLVKIVARDQWSVTVCVTSLDGAGNEQLHDVVLSWEEVDALARARHQTVLAA